MSFKVIFVVVSLVHVGLFRIGNGDPVQNLLNDCQARERYYAYSHLCFLSCESDGYCPDQSECLCDNRCGMSCIYHDRTSYCDPIPFPDNGFAVLKMVGHDDTFTISHGAELDFYCNIGYVLIGQQRLSCMASGVWDNPPPICINILSEESCGNPPSLPDAIVTMCENCVEEPIAIYTCNNGFLLVGNASVKCNNGIWESLDAVCIKKCCSLPNIPEHSLIEFNDLCSETELNFTCSEGYVLDGETQIYCRPHDMTWSDSPPRCVPKECDVLQLGVDLHTDTDEYIVGTSVTFSCSEGFILMGSANTVCLPSCFWSDGVPECQAITCTAPEVSSKNLFIHPVVKSMYLYGETVTYGCRSRYNNIVGDESRMCLHSGKFSGKEPTCHARCNMNKVSVVHNGVIVRSSEHYYFHGGWIEVYCRSTYRLVGASYFECKDGRWSSALDPVCLEDRSNDFVFPVVVHGHSTVNQVTTVVQGSTVTVDCMFLSRSRRPSWIIDPHRSKRQIPGKLHPPGNVYRMELTNVRDQDSGTYVCLTPFDSNRGKVHIKVIPACDDPGIPENGFRTGDDFTLGEIVVFWCPEGTTLSSNGRIIIRCMSIDNVAQWTDETPVCFNKNCQNTEFSAPANGVVTTTYPDPDTDFAILTFSCNPGYKLERIEQSQVTCQNAVWEGTLSECIKTCTGSQLETPSNGNSELSFPNPEEDKIIQTFQCNIGYQLDPVDTTAICTDGKWIPETPPTCLQKEDPFVINTNGRLDGREVSTVEKDGIYLDCIVPENFSTPTWTKLVDGMLKVTDKSFRNRMQFQMIALSDAGIYYCSVGQNNETIHISVKPLNEKCSVDLELPNGEVLGNRLSGKYYTGYERRFRCSDGFILNGDDSCTCQTNGWDCQVPSCIQDLTFELRTTSVERVNQTNVVVYAGSDVVIDCSVGDSSGLLFESGIFNWYRVMENQQRVVDGFHEFIVNDGNYLRLAIINIQSSSQGWYACASPIQSISIYIQVNTPCNIIPQPPNAIIHCENWRTDSVATCECEENYSINGSVTRRCLANGEWTGYECSCMSNRCETIQPLENGVIIKMSEYTIGGTLEFSCNPDYRLIGESVLECKENGSWNGSVPICEGICEDNECTANQKCVVVEEQAACVCKTTSDCPPDDQPVCGSDTSTYENSCLVQVEACDIQSDIDIVHSGKCQYGGNCHSKPVPNFVEECAVSKRFYYKTDLHVCVEVSAGLCMKVDEGFGTAEECNEQCSNYDTTCSLDVDDGFGPSNQDRFYYDQQQGTCAEFSFNGAGGNENNFKSRDECLKICPNMCADCTPAISLHVACRFDLQPMIVQVLDVNVESTETQVEISVLSPMRSNSVFNGSEIQSLLRYDQDPCQCPRILPLDVPYLMIPTFYIGNEPILDSGCYVAEFDDTLKYEINNLIESNEDCNKFFDDIKSNLTIVLG